MQETDTVGTAEPYCYSASAVDGASAVLVLALLLVLVQVLVLVLCPACASLSLKSFGRQVRGGRMCNTV